MTEAKFEEFLARCVSDAQHKNDALDAEYGLHSFVRWDDDRDRELLVFSNPGKPDVLEAKRTEIGSYSLRTQTWLWAWANEDFSPAAREASRRLQALHALTGFRVFVDPGIGASSADAQDFAALAVHQLEAIGFFRSPSDGPTLYLVVHERGSEAPPQQLPQRVMRR